MLVIRILRMVMERLLQPFSIVWKLTFSVLTPLVWYHLLLFPGHNPVVSYYVSHLPNLQRTLRGYVIPSVTGVGDDLVQDLVNPTHLN